MTVRTRADTGRHRDEKGGIAGVELAACSESPTTSVSLRGMPPQNASNPTACPPTACERYALASMSLCSL